MKFLAIIKRDNKLLEHQMEMMSMGEAILEATPQYCLQLFIILHTLDPTWTQWFSLITSLISLSIPTIQKYHSQQNTESFHLKEESAKALIKKVSKTFLLPSLVIFLNTLGKILCVTIIAVFFQFNIFAFGLYIGPLFVLLTISGPLYGLNKEKDINQQLLEASGNIQPLPCHLYNAKAHLFS